MANSTKCFVKGKEAEHACILSRGLPRLRADVGPRAQQHQQARRLRKLQEALQVRKAMPDLFARPRLVQVPGHVRLHWQLHFTRAACLRQGVTYVRSHFEVDMLFPAHAVPFFEAEPSF